MKFHSPTYSDYTPKYNVDLYHYSLSLHLDNIRKSKYLKARSCYSGVTRPAVWFTTNPVGEPTIGVRINTIVPYVPIQFKLSEFSMKHRLVYVMSWTEYCDTGGYYNDFVESNTLKNEYQNVDLLDAHARGVDPRKEWFMSLKDVPLRSCEEPRVWYNGGWASINHLDVALADAKRYRSSTSYSLVNLFRH